MSRQHRSEVFDWHLARELWRQGLRTDEVSFRLRVAEHVIYNQLDWLKYGPRLIAQEGKGK